MMFFYFEKDTIYIGQGNGVKEKCVILNVSGEFLNKKYYNSCVVLR